MISPPEFTVLSKFVAIVKQSDDMYVSIQSVISSFLGSYGPGIWALRLIHLKVFSIELDIGCQVFPQPSAIAHPWDWHAE